MALERRCAWLPADLSGRFGSLSLSVHSRPHELGLRLRAKLPRHTDGLEFRDRSPDWAHSRRMEYPSAASLRARRLLRPEPPCFRVESVADRTLCRST